MKCPYCIQDVPDGALVCSKCSRDLVLAHQFGHDLAALHTQIADLAKQVSASGERDTTEAPNAVEKRRPLWLFSLLLRVVLIAVIEVELAFLANYESVTGISENVFLVTVFLVPAVFGVTTALYIPGLPIWGHIKTGFAHTIVFYVLGSISSVRDGETMDAEEMVTSAAVSFALGIILASSGIFTSWVRQFMVNYRKPRVVGRTYFTHLRYAHGDDARTSKFFKRMKDLMDLLTPILTVLGSVTAAYIGYKAAETRAAPQPPTTVQTQLVK